MKKISVLIILCGTLFLICAIASVDGSRKNEDSLSVISTGGIFTGGAVVVSGETIIHLTEPVTMAGYDEKVQKKNGKTVEIVTDEAGKKRELKLDNVNVSDKEILIQQPNSFVEYAQVADGHYYYLRKEGENCYTLYCDRGIRIGSFGIEKGYYFQGCCKYGGRFYVILYHRDVYTAGLAIYNECSVLTAADFSTGKLQMIRKVENVEDYEVYFYKDKIRLYYSPDYEWDDEDDDEDEGEMIYQYDIIGSEEPDYDIEYGDYIMDGYRYYAKGEKEVRILRKRLEGKDKEEEVFKYETKRKKTPGETVTVSIDIDNEDIFIKEWVLEKDEITDHTLLYVVPRSGGKMKLVTDNLPYDDYVYNSKYIFWNDDFKIHKWNRRTQKEETVIKLPSDDSDYSWKVNCTERDLYISRRNLYGSIYCYPWLCYTGIDAGKCQIIQDTKESLGEKYDASYGNGYR